MGRRLTLNEADALRYLRDRDKPVGRRTLEVAMELGVSDKEALSTLENLADKGYAEVYLWRPTLKGRNVDLPASLRAGKGKSA